MRIVGGKFRGKALLSPTDDSIRPTSDRARESMFNILASRIGVHLDGIKVLDLFAGTGALRPRGHLTRRHQRRLRRHRRRSPRPHPRSHRSLRHRRLRQTPPPRRHGSRPRRHHGPLRPRLPRPTLRQGPRRAGTGLAAGRGWLAKDATIVLEESSEVELALPPGFEIDDRREYGAAAVHFIRAIP